MKREEIKEIIINIFLEIDPITEITEETYLLDDVLDSMGILYLLSEVYRQLKIEIPMQEVTISNFSTLEDIVALVEKYSKCEK
ncbi:MAG: acyl carrier protein [Lachnospiraceae bacterium]|nr:acyl carrier protein [Lachnospiraceae bacterium]